MSFRVTVLALICLATLSPAAAQTTKPAGTKGVTYDTTINTSENQVYTGTMVMAVDRGKVTGDLNLTSPTQITGKIAGTSKAGVASLDFTYQMTERKCEGNVKMTITLPAKPAPAKGTMEAGECGGGPGKVTGTVELKPSVPAKK